MKSKPTVSLRRERSHQYLCGVKPQVAYGYGVLTVTDGAKAVAVSAKHEDEIALIPTAKVMPRNGRP